MDLRNISALASVCLLSFGACALDDIGGTDTDISSETGEGEEGGSEAGSETSATATETGTTGDGDTGDGDGTTSGDGDGTSGDGDGTTSGDGDGTTSGDGDGTTSGDGDGTTSGDGDGTTSGDGDGDGCTTGELGCACFPNGSCFNPLQCQGGTCVNGDGDGDGTTGDGDGGMDYYTQCPSGNDSDCEQGEQCILGNSNGQDWSFCTPGECQGDQDCGFEAGDFCADLPGDGVGQDYCVSHDCTNSGCPGGMFCGAGFFGVDVCVWPDGGDGDGDGDGDGTCIGPGDPMPCFGNGECCAPGVCDFQTNRCDFGDGDGDGDGDGTGLMDGELCMTNAQCQGGFCYPQFGGGPGQINTVCASMCSADTGGFPPALCDEDADCCQGSCQAGGGGGFETCQ